MYQITEFVSIDCLHTKNYCKEKSANCNIDYLMTMQLASDKMFNDKKMV